MDRQDWLLAVIAAAGEVGLSPVQLQKGMFLLGREKPDEVALDYYVFEPYDYGPFSAQIYADAEALSWKGLVAIDNPFSRGWRRYAATKAGFEMAADLLSKMPNPASEYIAHTVQWIRAQSFPDLIRSIYEKYPEYREKSVFKG
jgi:uncharacterized protein YwgA